jgi:glycosyltransferase involved in cell wall biosynthesis
MKIDLTFPVLPPSLDGIGDHTAHLARALAVEGCAVRVLTAQEEWTPLRGVAVQRAFHLQQRRGILELIDVYRSRPHPDWLLLQFEQFSYGRWGLNPFLPLALRQIKRIAPATKIAVMFHEDYMPAHSIKSAIMSSWQRHQFWALGQLAEVAFFSTEMWAEKYKSWFPSTETYHLPVGSNIPKIDTVSSIERRRLGIPNDDFIIGLFGSAHPSRQLTHVSAALTACIDGKKDCKLLYVGADGDTVRDSVSNDVPMYDAGPLPADDVSRCLSAMDMYLAPFKDGVSTRRGSFLAGLQHSIPTVSTLGSETGSQLRGQNEAAFALVPWSNRDAFVSRVVDLMHDPGQRREMSTAARPFFDTTFDWSIIAKKLLRILVSSGTRNASPKDVRM